MQPHANNIVANGKIIENRPPHFRKQKNLIAAVKGKMILIHASGAKSKAEEKDAGGGIAFGAFVGAARVVDVIRTDAVIDEDELKWTDNVPDGAAIVLSDARKFKTAVPIAGSLGFWKTGGSTACRNTDKARKRSENIRAAHKQALEEIALLDDGKVLSLYFHFVFRFFLSPPLLF